MEAYGDSDSGTMVVKLGFLGGDWLATLQTEGSTVVDQINRDGTVIGMEPLGRYELPPPLP
jgi:hypothetical protein